MFEKRGKATISFVVSFCLSVCQCVRMQQLGSHWTDFHAIPNLCISSKICPETSRFIEIYTRITDTLHEGQYKY
jgi:hypothetical protein